jgi:hypothetical protein
MELKNNDCLQTPEWVYKPLGQINLDPYAGLNTNIGENNWRLEDGQNGLTQTHYGFVFCNPPFSQKELWIEKLFEQNNAILLLPERGSAPWFGPLAEALGGYFVMGKKVNFIGGPSSNNIGSVLFPYGFEAKCRIRQSGLPGHFVNVEYFKPRS